MLLKLTMLLLSMFWFADDGGGSAGDSDDGDGDSDQDAAAGDGDNQHGDDDAGLKSALEKERAARRDAVKAQKALQKQIDALNGKNQTDGEKLSAAETRADEAETRLRDATGRTAVYDAASKLNAISSRAVFASVRDELEYDDEGEPANVDEVLAALKKDEPDLFRHSKGRGDGGSGNTGDTREVSRTGNRLITSSIISPDEVERRLGLEELVWGVEGGNVTAAWALSQGLHEGVRGYLLPQRITFHP